MSHSPIELRRNINEWAQMRGESSGNRIQAPSIEVN